MTIQHMVWLKAPESATEAQMESLIVRILRMKSIPSVIDIVAGKNFKDTNHGYEYGVIMTYANKADQRRYIEHPDHEKLRDEIKAMGASMMALDFEH